MASPKKQPDDNTPAATTKATKPRQHGVKGVYYGGDWLDIEDCDGVFTNLKHCSGCPKNADELLTTPPPCPRSRSRVSSNTDDDNNDDNHETIVYDVVIIGAGCIGAAIARELSRYSLKTLLVEAADDVSQGATKGNSGIVHAGYDDIPGTNRAKYCWKGNQMFPALDKELRFGYHTNGSLVLAMNDKELEHLHVLKKRGETNGVERLRIVQGDELFEMEPHLNPNVKAALYAPDAGNVIPYEFTIALAENAVDNGVELRIRREVMKITTPQQNPSDDNFIVHLNHWEPQQYLRAISPSKFEMFILTIFASCCVVMACTSLYFVLNHYLTNDILRQYNMIATYMVGAFGAYTVFAGLTKLNSNDTNLQDIPTLPPYATTTSLVAQAGRAKGKGGIKVQVSDMFYGGSGSRRIVKGGTVEEEDVKARYVINCAGGASDQIARMIGDDSFTIKPRLGDYLLLNRNQGHLAKHTLFPCPDRILGKGVLVQTTLWGNLILGPTARDTYKPEARDMSPTAVQEYILSKCKKLVPSFDAKETIHAFCGARAKNSRGDWIIESSEKQNAFIHVAGIDSPGLAGCPAIALEVVRLLQQAGLKTPRNPTFNPNRAPIITPKVGMRGLKMGPVGKNDSEDGTDEAKMAANVICKCEKVTELEVVRAMRRSLPIDSTQAIRKRTRAGMGHCQGDPDNYNCEARVKAIIARENRTPVNQVGGRPWPATSTLTQRWIDEEEKKELQSRMDK